MAPPDPDATADVTPPQDDGAAADDGAPTNDVDVPMGADADADVPAADDGASVDRPDADVLDADAPDADVPPADVPITMQFQFVSGAPSGSSMDGRITMNSVFVWHGALRGSSSDGRITFDGWFR